VCSSDLTTSNWKEISSSQQYGLLPIKLDKTTKWIIAGISGKKANDILQTEKITYFWEKWLKQSCVNHAYFILNGSTSTMCSSLKDKI